MTTKDQERKTLEQIRKIVDGLGAESYVGRAFEGCFEMAEENIDNDFWNSPKECLRNARNNADEQGKKVQELNQMLQEANEDAKEWQKKHDKIHEKAIEYSNSAIENWNRFREQEDKVAELELENMKLKAKLYDMMMGAA